MLRLVLPQKYCEASYEPTSDCEYKLFSGSMCTVLSLSLSLSLLSNICFVFVYEFWNIFK